MFQPAKVSIFVEKDESAGKNFFKLAYIPAPFLSSSILKTFSFHFFLPLKFVVSRKVRNFAKRNNSY